MARSRLYFTARDVAAFCDVDPQTIHRWADAGRFDFFLTPGRQLRVRPVEVERFLSAFGYDVPRIVKDRAAAARLTNEWAGYQGAIH